MKRIFQQKRIKKRVEATRRSAEKTKDAFVSMGYTAEKAGHQMSKSFRVLDGFYLDDHRQ